MRTSYLAGIVAVLDSADKTRFRNVGQLDQIHGAKELSMRKIKACGVLVIRGEPIESFLLMVHADRFDLPKGHTEPGETERQCALRELYEETGIRAHDVELDPEFRYSVSYPVWPEKFDGQECAKTTVIFLGRLLGDVEISVTEHTGYQWRAWDPPHKIQRETIDPLLELLQEHLFD